jgi:hypothetical protein
MKVIKQTFQEAGNKQNQSILIWQVFVFQRW